jgi:hypothetical protein
MIRRHPHIFGDAAESPGWEALKAAERGKREDGSALAHVALALPALKRAEKLKAALHGSASTGRTSPGRAQRSTKSWPRSKRPLPSRSAPPNWATSYSRS